MLNIGIAEEIITPPRGVGLAGYFNKRPNIGVYDQIKVRAILFELDGVTSGIVCLDLSSITKPLFGRILGAIAAEGLEFGENLILCATHTHTGPTQTDDDVETVLVPTAAKVAMAVKRAYDNLAPGEIEFASIDNNPCGFVRRYWMKDGTVVTNPGKLNPDIVKPECDFDRKVNVIAFKQEGRIAALAVNLAQHGDTIGGNFVSGDWMGRLEREVQIALGEDVMVMTPMNASGNINHFDVSTDRNQTCYAEARRIGKEYSLVVLEALKQLRPVEFDKITVKNTTFHYESRKISPEQLAEARKTLEEIPETPEGKGDLTSEDLANGNPVVLRRFAKAVINCAEKSIPYRVCRLTAVELGSELAFVTLPGEPFNGISTGIQEKSPFKHTVVIELAQSAANYTPMPECFERGGYETRPGTNSSAVDNAPRMIEASLKNL